MKYFAFFAGFLFTFLVAQNLHAQHAAQRSWSGNVIVPNSWRQSVADRQAVQVEKVAASVVINELVATTQLDVFLNNPTDRDEMSEMVIPVPDGAMVRKFEFSGNSKGASAELLTHAEAKTTFQSIVAKLKDPALLELAGMNLVRSSVFPVPAGGNQQVRITYEHLLKPSGNRIDYVLPRSGSVSYDTPWTIDLKIESAKKITSLYSPTHPVTSSPVGRKKMTASVTTEGQRNPGQFQISWLQENGPITGSMFAFPDRDSEESGYFLLLAGLAGDKNEDGAANLNKSIRDLTLVIDRSGSMGGEKIDQAKNAAIQVLEGLDEGERFNVIVYNDHVEQFSENSVLKTVESMKSVRRFVSGITATGGTNLYDALAESLKFEPKDDALPLVMFLTDGLPTVGNTSEKAIRELVTENNKFDKRVFTFGVGVDVNTALLDKLAVSSRAFATFVLPGQDVEVAVGKVFRALQGPQLSSPQLRIVDADGKPDSGRVTDLLPGTLPDLYGEDQIVLMGRYHGEQQLTFQIEGKQGSRDRKFRMSFDVGESLKGNNSFVARLWASRKIGQLVDQVRDLGAESAIVNAANNLRGLESSTATAGPSTGTDPRVAELAQEILRLSMQFGILNEYTAFLATEGTDLSNVSANCAELNDKLVTRAMNSRSGWASYNQELNKQYNRDAFCLNVGNAFVCPDMSKASIATVQQCNDNAYFRRGNRWIDSRTLNTEQEKAVDREIGFGSSEYFGLLEKMIADGRQNELALDGEIVIRRCNESILISDSNPKTGTQEKAGSNDD